MPITQEELARFPVAPGVYIMQDKGGKVLYVGKAKNLRQRVRQYFVPGRDGRVIVPFLAAQVDSIETLIVSSEKEALLLENNLIKKHQPKYNALSKASASMAKALSTLSSRRISASWPRRKEIARLTS